VSPNIVLTIMYDTSETAEACVSAVCSEQTMEQTGRTIHKALIFILILVVLRARSSVKRFQQQHSTTETHTTILGTASTIGHGARPASTGLPRDGSKSSKYSTDEPTARTVPPSSRPSLFDLDSPALPRGRLFDSIPFMLSLTSCLDSGSKGTVVVLGLAAV